MKHAKGCDAPPEKPTISSTFSGRKKNENKSRFLSPSHGNFKVMNSIGVNPFARELQFLGTASFAAINTKRPPGVTDYVGICS